MFILFIHFNLLCLYFHQAILYLIIFTLVIFTLLLYYNSTDAQHFTKEKLFAIAELFLIYYNYSTYYIEKC